MTDYTDLIARLQNDCAEFEDPICGEAADALEAQARRIAELEYDATYHEGNDEVMMLDIEYYRARIAALEAALLPVAKECDRLVARQYYMPEKVLRPTLTAGELSAARAALGEKE